MADINYTGPIFVLSYYMYTRESYQMRPIKPMSKTIRRKVYAKCIETIILEATFNRPEPGTFFWSRDTVDVHPGQAERAN